MIEIGVIFDFNGTMFFDSNKHEEAWQLYVEELTGKTISGADIRDYIHGRNAADILEHFIGGKMSKEMVMQFSEEKESIYRRLCREDKKKLTLAPGLREFLDYLLEVKVPIGIATAANKANMLLYFDVFGLDYWFDFDNVAYDDGTLRGKPYPDIYSKACKLLKVTPNRCIVFEDAYVGLQSAKAAGVENIVAVVGDSDREDFDKLGGARAIINDYSELDKSLTIKDI